MATLSLSDQILLEISKSSQPMTAQRLAGAISHDLSKTRALIQFMVRNDKLFAAGAADGGSQTYGLTAHGRNLSAKIENAANNPDTAGPRPVGLHDHRPLLTQPAQSEATTTPEPSPRATLEPHLGLAVLREMHSEPSQESTQHTPAPASPAVRSLTSVRFGMLNTGELIFIAPSGLNITLRSDEIAALRDMIGSGS